MLRFSIEIFLAYLKYVLGLTILVFISPLLVDAESIPSLPGWVQIPNSAMSTVCAATQGFPQVNGGSGCLGILAWSGGIMDTKRNRLVVWGGGHNDYYGNELYAFNLDMLTMTRLNDPTMPLVEPRSTDLSKSCSDRLGSGDMLAANSRHTYDGIEYLANVDRMFVFSGSLAACGHFGKETWTFDFSTMRWQNMEPVNGDHPKAGVIMTAYDPNSGLVFLHDLDALYSYNFATNTYKRLSQSGAGLGYHRTAAIDPQRKKFVIVGYDSVRGSGQVHAYDIGPGSTYALQTLSTTGGHSVIGTTYPGIDYDPVLDRIVTWNGGDSVYLLNMDTLVWTPVTYTGAPPTPSAPGHGTHGRWRYSAKSNVYILVNEANQNVYLFRSSSLPSPDAINPGEISPAPPTALQIVQ